MLTDNFILRTDSYKSSHFLQYPPGTDGLFSYIESRGGEYDTLLFFGLQYYLKRYLSQPITMEMVDEAAAFFKAHGEPFPYEGWKRIVEVHHGLIPVKIRALPEGTLAPQLVPLVTVESTNPQIPWIVSWIETSLLRAIWYPTTVASNSWRIKRAIKAALELTADDPTAEIAFKLHDFGARGVSSAESAGIGGAAHLVNFMGSDTVEGVVLANRYYDCEMAGFSIPAAEHSSITSWGRDHEVDAYRNMLTQFAQKGKLVAIVSDSYNIYNACEKLWGEALRDEVVKSEAVVIIRPDSGNPPDVVARCAEILGEKFGFTTNSKGFKVLNNVRIIQGDGINYNSINDIIAKLINFRWSISNIAFGMGGALLQQINRDTLQFAMKCSAISVNGEWRDVYKEPATDALKNSKRGLLDTVMVDGKLDWARLDTTSAASAMETVFNTGEIKKTWTFDEIRKRAG